MASIKDLKRRIGSVKSTQQTTKAMKLVSAAKLRRAQDAIVQHRPYAQGLIRLLTGLVGSVDRTTHPLLAVREGTKKTATLVIVTSDRGLCGSFNSSVIKAASKWLKENQALYSEVKLACIGKRGYEFFKSRHAGGVHYFEQAGGKVSFAKAKAVSDELVSDFLNEKTDSVFFLYNEFLNAVSQRVKTDEFLPLDPSRLEKKGGTGVVAGELTIVKPGVLEVFQSVVERTFPVRVYRILLESQAGEHGARMSTMENATKNAGEMIKKLTLQYNKQRQANITKELLEIISGSESQSAQAG